MDIMADIARKMVSTFYKYPDKLDFLAECDKMGMGSDQAYLIWAVIEEVIFQNEQY